MKSHTKLFASLLLFFQQLCFAENSPSPIILEATEIKSVRVVLSPPGLLTRTQWNEQDLYESSCSYETHSYQEVKIILEALQNFTLYPANLTIYRLRGAIYLELKNGQQIKFLMDDGADTSGERYIRVYGYPGTESLKVTPLAFTALTNWTKSAKFNTNITRTKGVNCAD
ncbi:hypothetical protein ACLB1G_20275 [Oxalobacteraceae bacterium A2-2]